MKKLITVLFVFSFCFITYSQNTDQLCLEYNEKEGNEYVIPFPGLFWVCAGESHRLDSVLTVHLPLDAKVDNFLVDTWKLVWVADEEIDDILEKLVKEKGITLARRAYRSADPERDSLLWHRINFVYLPHNRILVYPRKDICLDTVIEYLETESVNYSYDKKTYEIFEQYGNAYLSCNVLKTDDVFAVAQRLYESGLFWKLCCLYPVQAEKFDFTFVPSNDEEGNRIVTFDLSGREVESLTEPGIYIQRGSDGTTKKLLIK